MGSNILYESCFIGILYAIVNNIQISDSIHSILYHTYSIYTSKYILGGCTGRGRECDYTLCTSCGTSCGTREPDRPAPEAQLVRGAWPVKGRQRLAAVNMLHVVVCHCDPG